MKTSKFLLGVCLTAALTACKKEDEQAARLDENSAHDIAMTLTIDEEMNNLVEMSLEGDPGKKNSSTTWTNCATLSLDTVNGVNTITLDFGPTNCKGSDGKYRRGIISISFEDNPFDAGSVYIIESDGYAVNDFQVDGSKTITYMGPNSDNDPYSQVHTNIQVVKPDSSSLSWSSDQARVWIDGFGDFNPFNNAVEISGTAAGKTATGINYSILITDPLRVEATCNNIVSGTLEINGPTFETHVLDYGNGDCDAEATLTVNGNTTTILLK